MSRFQFTTTDPLDLARVEAKLGHLMNEITTVRLTFSGFDTKPSQKNA
jgi:hypothetical protein